ncbi:MAG: D-arabinono-1,4-lactone oxidase [Candidatus Binatia bacterium]|nr:D-arabinono-1,4-lactone oxidase [Candidatus Binatia bacterium]
MSCDDATLIQGSNPTWQNWTGNLVYAATRSGEAYYFRPASLGELREILDRRPAGIGLRVSGQRHSQPPLVLPDDREGPETASVWIIDMSCYADLGPSGRENILLGPGPNQVTVNTGVLEDTVAAFVAANDKILSTVTAGGFFSLGGITAVDVLGSTIDAPIFPETASAFTLVGPDGREEYIDASTPGVDGFSALQFARVSLGTLGVATSVTLDVKDRPFATSLRSGTERHQLTTESAFVERYRQLVRDHDRLESFYNPYSQEFLVLWWDIVDPVEKTPNLVKQVTSACRDGRDGIYGATLLPTDAEESVEELAKKTQFGGDRAKAEELISLAFSAVESQVAAANKEYSDLWLSEAAQTLFMSYYVELPAFDDAGLAKVWRSLQAVRANLSSEFLVAGPLEFRFVRAGQTALAATYSDREGSRFVNLDLIAFVETMPSSAYAPGLLQFFANVERDWIGLGGWPHNGKMYGFSAPSQATGFSTPFNPDFVAAVSQRRGVRLSAFEKFRSLRDPEGVFCNDFVRNLLLCR